MKRNIIATLKISRESVTLSVIERLNASTSLVEILTEVGQRADMATFLASALKKVSALIGASLSQVGIVIDPSLDLQAKISLDETSARLSNGVVTSQDINLVLATVKEKFTTSELVPILIQPLSFHVIDENDASKKYFRAPVDKPGVKVKVVSAVTTVAASVVAQITALVKSQRLEISQILLSSQVLAQNHLSPNALISGVVHLHVTDEQTFVTINKNTATLAQLVFYTHGFKKLVAGVTKVFGCSDFEARNLLAVYADAVGDQSKVIFTRQNGLNEEFYTSADLNAIVRAFLKQMALAIKQYLAQKSIKNFPIVISGKVWKIENITTFFKKALDEEYVSLYSPLSFAEFKESNTYALGMLKLMINFDQVLGARFNTEVETNPNTISNLRMPSTERKWYSKVFAKIGGHYDWK